MVIFPFIIGAMTIMVIYYIVMAINTIIQKIGLSIVSYKMGIRMYGLLWIPVIGSWFEATVVSRFMKKGNGIRILYFSLSLILYALYVATYILDYTTDLQKTIRDLMYIFFFVQLVIKNIIRTIAMKKAGFNIFGALCINFLIPSFWTYFMIGKAKDYNSNT